MAKTILRIFCILPLVCLLAWANWEAPAMHHFARPVETAIWQLAPLSNPAAAETLRRRLATETGVSACAISLRTGCVALVYHPDEVTPDRLYAAVGRAGGHILTNPTPSAAPALRQCPVPPGALVFVDKVRFALNLRRFFVRV